MNKQLIKDLKIGHKVETQTLVVEANTSNYSSSHRGKEQFMKLTLGDVSGTIRGIIWNMKMVKEPIHKGDVIFIKGEVNEYHGPQIVISEVKKLDSHKVNRKMIQPVSERDPQDMLQELKSIITEEIEDTYLQKLLKCFFADREFVKKFAFAPAAKSVHHNYVGGLLEHTLEVVYYCRQMIEMHPQEIYPDLLLTGAILHDMGKIEEYDLSSISFEMSTRGKLIGHITIGKEMLDQYISSVGGFPEELRLELEHILLTHHGQKEWGSPEVPKTIQAFALHYADLVSARLNQFAKLVKNHQSADTSWTDWDRFLERNAYISRHQQDK